MNPPFCKHELHWILSYCSYLKAKDSEAGERLKFKRKGGGGCHSKNESQGVKPFLHDWMSVTLGAVPTRISGQAKYLGATFWAPLSIHPPCMTARNNIVSYREDHKESWENFFHDTSRLWAVVLLEEGAKIPSDPFAPVPLWKALIFAYGNSMATTVVLRTPGEDKIRNCKRGESKNAGQEGYRLKNTVTAYKQGVIFFGGNVKHSEPRRQYLSRSEKISSMTQAGCGQWCCWRRGPKPILALSVPLRSSISCSLMRSPNLCIWG